MDPNLWFLMQAIDHIINSAAKSNYMSAGQISVPIVFRGPNGAAAGVGAQHSHVWWLVSWTFSCGVICQFNRLTLFCTFYRVPFCRTCSNVILTALFNNLLIVLCSLVCLLPRLKGADAVFIWGCSWTAKSCHTRPWSCYFPRKWIIVSISVLLIWDMKSSHLIVDFNFYDLDMVNHSLFQPKPLILASVFPLEKQRYYSLILENIMWGYGSFLYVLSQDNSSCPSH